MVYTIGMEPLLQQKINEQSAKLDTVITSVKKIERYFQWIFWGTIVMFLLPIIAAVFIIPMAISSYTATLNGLI